METDTRTEPKVVKITNVCFGRAHIEGTRIPIWILIIHLRRGRSEEEIFRSYPMLTHADLDVAWEYYRAHALEIDRDVWYQDVAGAISPDQIVPMSAIIEGIRLGLDEPELRESFDPPLSEQQVAAAWWQYRLSLCREHNSRSILSRAG